MCKKYFVYLNIFFLSMMPLQKAHSVSPVVGIAYAIDLTVPLAIRFLSSEIAINSIVKAVQVSNAYYSASSRISNSNFMKFFKSKSLLGVTAFTSILSALGYSILNDGTFVIPWNAEIKPGDVAPQKGYAWCDLNKCGINVSEAADKTCNGYEYCQRYEISKTVLEPDRDDLRRVAYYTSETNIWRTFNVQKRPCDIISSSQIVATCDDNWSPSTGEPQPVDDELVQFDIFTYIESMNDDQVLDLISDKDGYFDKDLTADLTSDDAPPMPDGQSPIPDIGDDAWTNAHLIATGVAQSSNPSEVNYVSPDYWDDSAYLAGSVAGSSSYVTGLNSGVISPPDVGNPVEPGEGVISIDLSGVEKRIDTTNSINQEILNEIIGLSSSSITLQQLPDSQKASSFWEQRYPDGLIGVWQSFNNDFKNTAMYDWIDSFRLNYQGANIPAWGMCFDMGFVDFGCHDIEIDSRVWIAIKTFILFTAAVLARRLVFGG